MKIFEYLPTPVSALLHAATMVTAGVYLTMRCSPIIEFCSTGLIIITFVGAFSAFLGASAGLFEHDFKRIIAFSTTSQLGYMLVACGLSQYNIALFHLINHAFFKALLFLSAGAVIHALSDNQDIRKMGSLIILLPKSYLFIFIGSLSLMAFPFMTGFYSKDFLLEFALIPKNFSYSFAYLMTLLAAFLTATYSIRLLLFAFLSKPSFSRSTLNTIQDPDLYMFIPLFLLSLGAIFFGYLSHDLFLGIGTTFYQNSLFTHPNHFALFDGPLSQPSFFKFIPLFTFLFLLLLLPLSYNHQSSSHKSIDTFNSSPQHFLIEPTSPIYLGSYTNALNYFNIFNYWIINVSFSSSQIIYRYFDRGLLELFGPLGLVRITHFLGSIFELYLATGFLLHYAFILILSFFITIYFTLDLDYLLFTIPLVTSTSSSHYSTSIYSITASRKSSTNSLESSKTSEIAMKVVSFKESFYLLVWSDTNHSLIAYYQI